ncbi:MAG: tetratricopeptide repeat protein, partial [Bacteroidales bacterium]
MMISHGKYRLLPAIILIAGFWYSCFNSDPKPVSPASGREPSSSGNDKYFAGLRMLDIQELDSAMHCFRLSRNYFSQEGDFAGQFRAQLRIGDVFRIRGNLAQADSMLNIAETGFAELAHHHPLLESELLHFRGVMHRISGNVDSAIICYQRAISVRGTYSIDDTLLLPALVNLGNLLFSRRDFDLATEYYCYADSLAHFKKTYDRTYGILLQNAALNYSAAGMFDLSDIFFQKALAVLRSTVKGDDLQLAVCLNLYATALIRRGGHQEAL